MPLDRNAITSALTSVLEPLPWVYALWEGGSTAFGRADEWSDLDLMIDCDEDKVDDAFALAEATLVELSGGDQPGAPAITIKYPLPLPTFHGHAQTFYQLRDAGPFLMLDLVVMKHDQGMRFSEVEQHGKPIIYFDKTGSVKVSELDWAAHIRLLETRLAALSASFPLFQSLVTKDILRHDALNAFSFFQGLTLRPLVELLRIVHDPAKHSFHLRYAKHYLPPDAVRRLESFCFVGNVHELSARHQEAMRWFDDLLPQARASINALKARHAQDSESA